MSPNPCLQALEAAGLSCLLLDQSREQWRELTSSAPVSHLLSEVEYQREYLSSAAESYLDANVILTEGGRPLAVWPLCAVRLNGAWRLGSNAGEVLEPFVAEDVGRKRRKELVSQCLDALNRMAANLGMERWRSLELSGEEGLSEWQARQMDRNGRIVETRHDLRVRLDWEEEDIRACFRKSYKPLISKAARLWKAAVVDAATPELDTVFEEFRLLHLEVAGRATRSLRSWELQLAAVRQGEGFLVSIRDAEHVLVGAALFSHSRTAGVYAVAAYRRELFDQPVGHLAQMEAIRHMKRLGLRWYRIGIRPYAGDAVAPSAKEQSIGLFKEGFATHRYPCLVTEVPVRLETEEAV